MKPVDAILLLSFGGPESTEDVVPFLRRVTAGRGVPDNRLQEVAKQYESNGGKSPINEQNRLLLDAVRQELANRGTTLPMYFGNRNWHPLVEETVAKMQADGVEHAACFVTSAFSSYSGCRQYKEDIARAQSVIDNAPTITKVRQFFNHPGFINAMAENLKAALDAMGESKEEAVVAFTAHSIPTALASTCRYQAQLDEAARLVMKAAGAANNFDVVFQSRSGAPQTPWLEPDINDHLHKLHANGHGSVVIAPLGFISDHQEVIYDLDTVAMATASSLGLVAQRVPTVGVAPSFVRGVADLLEEVIHNRAPAALGSLGVVGCQGPACCPAPMRH